jgi:small-conductance mechanosensitive channel
MSMFILVTSFTEAWQRIQLLLTNAAQGLFDVAIALLVFMIGWLVARLLSRLTLTVLRRSRFNEAVRTLRTEPGAPLGLEPAAIASWVVYWTLILLAVMLAADILGFDLTASVGDRLREVLPRVMAATIELIVGIGVAMALGAVTRRLFETAGMRHSKLRGQLVTILLSVFAVLLALEQLGIAAQLVISIGITAVAAVGAAVALAFGLGCRDLARDFVIEYLRSLDEEPRHTR